jgi:hypothetical protein
MVHVGNPKKEKNVVFIFILSLQPNLNKFFMWIISTFAKSQKLQINNTDFHKEKDTLKIY